MHRKIEEETGKRMSSELEFVLQLTREKTAASEARIRALLNAGLNWNEVMACAIQHKLLLVLQERLHAEFASRLDSFQQRTLSDFARSTGFKNMAFLGESLRLHRLFEPARIPAIPHRGPVLAWLAYHNFASRMYTDLDFVVPQRYIPQAILLLESAGYQPRFDPTAAQTGKNAQTSERYAFVNGSIRTLLELHTEKTLHYFPRRLNLDEMNSRVIPIEIGGEKLWTFGVEDTLMMLCVHGAEHFWERLGWILDVAKLITAAPLDWALAMRIAAANKCSRLLLLGLILAHDLFGSTLPQDILAMAQGDADVRWLVGKVLEEIEGISTSSTGALPRAAFRLRSQDGLRERASQLLRMTTGPAEMDQGTPRLPKGSPPLASVERSWSLLREQALGFRRRPKPDLAPFVPTPPHIVERMLELAEVTHEDVLYDLGCGHGAIVVAAAKKYGIRTVGVDIDPRRLERARAHARDNGVEKRVQFILGDAKKMDLSEATVITVYLGIAANLRLVERFHRQLRPGSRIVSRDFQIYSWEADRLEKHLLENGAPTYLYLWKIKQRET
jgi:hypothetical protein